MFYLVGLRKDGRLVLYDRMCNRLNEEELARIAASFNYVQMLQFDDVETILRYEYDDEPRLREVPISGTG